MAPLSVTLPGASSSPHAARTVLREWLADEGCGHLDDEGALLVSELVTNAVVHGGEPIRLSLCRSNGTVRVEVFDSSAVLARRGDVHSNGSGGRGLQIVESLASEWGSDAVDGGKITWACLLVARPPRKELSTTSLR